MRGLRCHLHLRWPQKGRRRFVEMNMELLVRIAFRSLKRRACANVHKLYEMSVHSLMAPTQPVRRSGKKLDFCCFWPLRAPKRRLSAARARPRAPSRPSPGAQTHLHSRETAPRAPRSTRSTKSGLAASPRDALLRAAIGASSLRRLICASSRRSPGMSRVTAKSPRQSLRENSHRADAAARLSRERGRRAGSSSRPRARWLRSRRTCVGSRSRPRCPATGLRR